MMGSLSLDAVQEVTALIYRVGMADLASWQEAAISFGFVFGIVIVGFLLERLVVGLHA